jgi:hypothetical protein
MSRLGLLLLPTTLVGLSIALARTGHVRRALLQATILTGLLVVLITEGLSAANALSRGPVLTCWSVAALLAAGSAAVSWRGRTHRWTARAVADRLRPLSRAELSVALAVALLLAAELLVAMVSMPNNWDSMTYHLARVGHWIQNRNVAFYPTANDRQLYSAPFAEYAITNVQLLSLSVKASNLVQWTAHLLAVVAATDIARQLGARRMGQLLAASLCASLPMAVLQSTSTQNDLVLGAWVLIASAQVLQDIDAPSSFGKLLAASAVGLAILTKGTAYVVLAPIVTLWLADKVRRRSPRELGITCAVTLVASVAINAAFIARNEAQWHRPLGPPSATSMLANASPVTAVVPNLLRSAATQLTTPMSSFNRLEERFVEHVAQATGSSTDDRASTYGNTKFTLRWLIDEDFQPDPLHTALALIAVALLIAYRRRVRRLLIAYTGAWLIGCVAFCAYLRWQPWISRLELPLLLLAMPTVAVAFSRGHRSLLTPALSAILVIAGCAILVRNDTRPMMSGGSSVFTRSTASTMFAKRKNLRLPYQRAVDDIERRQVRGLGLAEGGDDWEYPLWVMLGSPGPTPMIIDASSQDADTFHAAPPRFDAVFCTRRYLCSAWAGKAWSVVDYGEGVTVAYQPRHK